MIRVRVRVRVRIRVRVRVRCIEYKGHKDGAQRILEGKSNDWND